MFYNIFLYVIKHFLLFYLSICPKIWAERCAYAQKFGQRDVHMHKNLGREMSICTKIWAERCPYAQKFGQRDVHMPKNLGIEMSICPKIWA